MTKKGRKIHKRAQKVGAYLKKDSQRKDGGLLYTVGAYRTRWAQMGKLGPASGVRRINPETGEVIEVISQSAIEKEKAKSTSKGKRHKIQK